MSSFATDFIRPLPPELPITDDELYFIAPCTLPDVQWDFSLGMDCSKAQITKEIFNKALKFRLSEYEESVLIDSIKDEKVSREIGIDTNCLPQLTEMNVKVAAGLLISIASQPQIKDYLEKFFSMEISMSSMELITLLAAETDLPQEFIKNYILYSIEFCTKFKNAKEKDKPSNKVIRAFSVFVKGLIKHDNFNPRDIITELQAFCIEFTTVPEANALFKILKQIDDKKE
eukprot:TRINITY_DN5123_c0_g1_i1.p1 TRINITY_DN5123_c0_g1~~TRINITY_DN5123_c0_g1_i1.p1  ORF type:complete len:230 (+),score=51.21 TRINITY_DN5123_c0_g1_i1:660-1349(+)